MFHTDTKRIVKFLVLTLAFYANFFYFLPAEGREIIFVVNSGQNMNISDPFRAVPGSIIWSAENFSAEDEVGIITFKENPRIVRPLSKVKDNLIENFQVEYSGQSNVSAALLQAVDILSKKFNTERAIIFFTDGENLLDKSSKNAMFVENVKAGLRQAKWLGIPVYILSLRSDLNPKNYHSYEWAKEIPLNYLDLMTAVRTIIHNEFKTPYINILATNSAPKNFSFEVPITAPDRLKILLLSSSAGKAEIENIKTVSRVDKNFLKVFEVDAPLTNKFELSADFPQGTGLTLDVIPTISGRIEAEISTSIFGADILEVTPIYKNSDAKIFEDKFFDGKAVRLQINGRDFAGEVKNGVIKVPLENVGENISLQKIHFENLGVIFNGEDTAQLKNGSNIIVWLIAVAAILTILILSWRLQKKSYGVASAAALEKNFSYHGKLIISAPDEEFSTREINLFRITTAQISLMKILESCGIENFSEFEGIWIKPAAQGILIENGSACTITKENEIIERGEIIELFYNDSIKISTEYGAATLKLIFESLKPNF